MPEDTDSAEDYLQDKEKRASKRRAQDVQLWQAWQDADKSPEAMQPLLQRFEPGIQRHLRSLRTAKAVAPAGIQGSLSKHTIKAIQTWDPNRPGGASLNTHVTNYQKKVLRQVQKYQNPSYIPEAKAQAIGPVQRSTDVLREQFGRPPTDDEVATHLRVQPGIPKTLQNVTAKQIGQINKMQVKDVPASAFESDPVPWATERGQEVLSLLPTALNPKELSVFNALKANPKATNAVIAKQLKLSPHQTHRVRESIYKKYKKYE